MRITFLRVWPLIVVMFARICFPTHANAQTYQNSLMIDSAEYDWCHHDCAPFDRPTYFYCFQAADQILIGSRKADWIWMYDTSKLRDLKWKQVSLRFDNDSIWIIRPDGKETRLNRDYSEDVFSNSECEAEVRRHWIKEFDIVKRPATVPAEAVLVPQGERPLFRKEGPHFWVKCSFNPGQTWDLCTIWDEKGMEYKEEKCVNSSNQPVPAADLVVDPITTKFDYEIHLKNEATLKAIP